MSVVDIRAIKFLSNDLKLPIKLSFDLFLFFE